MLPLAYLFIMHAFAHMLLGSSSLMTLFPLYPVAMMGLVFLSMKWNLMTAGI